MKKVEIIQNKQELLKKLKLKIENLKDCELKNNANKIVFGYGNEDSSLMIIGEGPGQKEDELGKPFVGDAGILLNKMLAAINLDRKDIYFTNVVNYRPPSNRKPEIKEIKRYSEYLYEHVEIINPKMIILLGSTAMEAFFGSNLKIYTFDPEPINIKYVTTTGSLDAFGNSNDILISDDRHVFNPYAISGKDGVTTFHRSRNKTPNPEEGFLIGRYSGSIHEPVTMIDSSKYGARSVSYTHLTLPTIYSV